MFKDFNKNIQKIFNFYANNFFGYVSDYKSTEVNKTVFIF